MPRSPVKNMSIFSDSKPTSNTLHIIASTELLICEDIPINTTHLICSISTKDSEPVYLVVGFQSKPLILQDVCPKTEPAFESGGKGKEAGVRKNASLRGNSSKG